MRRLATVVAGIATLVATATVVLGTALAGPASAATPADKPVVTVGPLVAHSSGGVSPDTWHDTVVVPVAGYNFTPGGRVYVTLQDLTAGTAALNGDWITAGTGPCGQECNNAGRISYNRNLTFDYHTACGHVIRAWAWDDVKSPRTGYGWSYRDAQVTC